MKIFSDSPLPEAAVRLLCDGAAPHEILFPRKPVASVLSAPEPDAAFGEAEIAYGQPDLESIRNSGKLRWLHISTAGFTRYDTPEFRALMAERGIVVTNSSRVYARACAEQTLAFMLAEARRLPEALASQAPNGSPEWFKLRRDSRPMNGQKVVILGYGGIASELVKLLAPFEMEIVAMRRAPRGDEPVRVVKPERLFAELADADHVINILPDNVASRNAVDEAMFSEMKPGVVFHNIGRGTTVDQNALLEALRSGRVGAAWLDVTEPEPLPEDHPLRAEPRCYITPHIAGGHGDEATTSVRHFLENLRRFDAGEPMLDRIM